MIDPADALDRFLQENGVGAWVIDDMGRHQLREHWASDFVDQVGIVVGEEDAVEADRMRALRVELDEKPRKSITVKKLREIIDD